MSEPEPEYEAQSESHPETLPAPSGDGAMQVPESSTSLQRREAQMMQAVQPGSLDEMIRLAQLFYESGYFGDIQNTSQAVAKMVAGAELGLAPMESMRSVHAFDGKTSLHYTQILSLIRRSQQYDYEIAESTDTRAEIIFYRHARGEWREEGRQEWTWQDAKTAGLTGKKNWKNYPRAMLLGRAATEGQRKYCPDVGGGPLYVPEELGADVDSDGRPTDAPERASSPASSRSSESNTSSHASKNASAHMMQMMGRVLDAKPAWLIEHVTGYGPSSPSELTSEQIDQVTETLDEIDAVATEHGIDDVHEWIDWAERNGADLTNGDHLQRSARAWKKQRDTDASEEGDDSTEQVPIDKAVDATRSKLQEVYESGEYGRIRSVISGMERRANEQGYDDAELEQLRRVVIPYMAIADLVVADNPNEVNTVMEWLDQQIAGWGEEAQQDTRDLVEPIVRDVAEKQGWDTHRPDGAEAGTDATIQAMQNGESALDSQSPDLLPDEPLPSGFPAKSDLEAAGIETLPKLDREVRRGTLREIDGIGQVTEKKVTDRLEAIREGEPTVVADDGSDLFGDDA